MKEEEIAQKIADKKNISVEEVMKQAESKKEELKGMVTLSGALILIASENNVELETKRLVEEIGMSEEDENMIEGVDENEIVDQVKESGFDKNGEAELSLEDLGKKFIKSPKVGEEVEFTLKKIVKSKNINAIDKDGKKFKTNLTSVDYKIVYVSEFDEELSIHSWEAVGKINAICKKLKKIEGVRLRVKHIRDGMKEKNVETYLVQAQVDGKWKSLDRKTGQWIESQ
jgi:hypothetical protein